uniref:Xylulose kinase-1 n=1 Tax=Tanacetum cinerariifolium TaxID=118510 RepID=A0A6L2MYC1_TANCI|nr:hypothetical protein [Tanacetum cinerariifolium]
MALTFADTHNMIAYLTKSDTYKGFEKIIDFLNASMIQYALTVNPTLYVSCIKQFWSSVSLKKTNDVVRLQALIDRRKVVITEDTVRQALRLEDAKSVNYLPNEEIFAELARMGFEKASTKLTFYKAFFSAQWKFLIHTILQCMSVKRTAWNKFSSSMASAVICLATGRKFNFLKYIFDSLVRNVDSSSKFYMYPRFLQLIINAQIADLSSHSTKYTSPSLIQKVFANMRRDGKGFSGVNTPLFEGMLVPQVQDDIDAADDVADDVDDLTLLWMIMRMHPNRRGIAELDADEDVTLEEVAAEVPKDAEVQGRLEESQAQVYHLDLEHADKVLSMQDDEAEPAKLKEVIEVVTTVKLIREVVIAATITAAPSAARRRNGVVIRDPEERATSSVVVHSELKSKDKGKSILVKRKEKQDNTVLRYQALKRKPQTEAQARKNMMVYLKNMNGFKMDFFKGMTYDDIRPIFEKHFNSIVAFLEKGEEELEEEASKAIKRKSESSEEKAAKKQKLNKEVKELKIHLQIVLNDEDDVYTEATPLALKVPVIDHQIHTEHNKPYYKIIRAYGTHQLFLSFISLLRNFDREDLKMLGQLVQKRFASSEPKNFSDDFLLTTLKAMFEKPNVEVSIWKSQRGSYALAKVKS